MRSVLAFLAVVTLALGSVALHGCGKGSPISCKDTDWKCGNDGRLYCRYLPSGVQPLDLACCPAPPASLDAATAAGADAEAIPPDAGTAEPPDAGTAEPPDAAAEPPDAGAPAQAADAAGLKDAGEDCGDGGFMMMWWGLYDAGVFPRGRDDAGLAYVYRCGWDICRLPEMPYDAGVMVFLPPDAGPGASCGPVGCQ